MVKKHSLFLLFLTLYFLSSGLGAQTLRERQLEESINAMELYQEHLQNRRNEEVQQAKPPKFKDMWRGDPEKMIRESLAPFRQFSETELLDMFMKNPPIKKIAGLKPRKKDYHFLIKLYRDPDALPKAAAMFKDKKKLLHYGLANLALILLGFLLRKMLNRPELNIVDRFKRGLFRFLFINGARLGLFILFFSINFKPLFQIFKQHYFS